MATKFTKGTWGVSVRQFVVDDDGRLIADAGMAMRPDKEKVANARLIAAAPEMYDALNDIMFFAKLEKLPKIVIDNAEMALAKARGEAKE